MVARQDAHHFAALGVDANVRPQRVHHVDGFGLGQFPRPRGEGVGLRCQRADRAKVDDIALKVRIERGVEVGRDLCILAPAGLAHLGDARHLGREAHAAGAGDAARHAGFDQRAKVQILVRALRFTVAAEIDAIGDGLVLKVAFATLIADRTVKRVVDEEELHHPFPRLLHHGGVGLDDRRLPIRAGPQVPDLHRAGGGGLGRAAHDLDKAHPAVARDRQPFVIAETRDLDSRLLTSLDQRQVRIDLDLGIVDDDLSQIRHVSRPFTSRDEGFPRAPVTSRR